MQVGLHPVHAWGWLSSPTAIDSVSLAAAFPYKEFVIKHNLVGSDLFDLERLVQLALTLPADSIDLNLCAIEFS